MGHASDNPFTSEGEAYNAHPLTGRASAPQPPKITVHAMSDKDVRKMTAASFHALAAVIESKRNNARMGNLGDLGDAIRATTMTARRGYAGPINDIARRRLLADAEALCRELRSNGGPDLRISGNGEAA